jgi:hypothetical protein
MAKELIHSLNAGEDEAVARISAIKPQLYRVSNHPIAQHSFLREATDTLGWCQAFF